MRKCVCGIEQPPFEFRPNGASLVERDQKQYLREAGYEVFTVRPRYPEVPKIEGEIHLPSLKLPNADNYRIAYPFDPLSQRELALQIREIHPEMIYLHGPYQVASRLAAIAKKQKIPFALHMHTHISGYVESRVPEHLWPLAKFFSLKRAKKLANSATVTIFPSITYKKVFMTETGYTGPSLVFPSFIQPFELLDEKALERVNYSFRRGHLSVNPVLNPGIVVHSRLEKEKNPEYPMKCFHELLKRLHESPISGINFPVLIYVGGGTASCREHLEWLAKEYGIVNQVYFAGARSHDEAKGILQTANQCWFLSDKDTQGMVPFEAGLAGVPVFGLKDQPFAEFFGEKEFLVVAGDSPTDLAGKAYALLSNKALHAEMAEHCHKVATSYSDVERYKKEFLDLCELIVIGAK